ncbi:MAG: methyltransferase domain-containing protein [Myxococcales bacterium]|nr:methyltransferase domain-containing protein [Myxococcales bacterium]
MTVRGHAPAARELRFDPEPAILARAGEPLPPRDDGQPLSSGYPAALLEKLPESLRALDRGCGDAGASLREGDVVIDLGCGAGLCSAVCAARVGAKGHVIGIDFNGRLVEAARDASADVGQALGYRNLQFHRARVQDLTLDLESLDAWLGERPLGSVDDLVQLDVECDRLRLEEPLLSARGADVALANLTLSQVRLEDRAVMAREVARVLRPGGRLLIADLFASAPLPQPVRGDAARWAEGVGGAFVEAELRAALEAAGFTAIEVTWRADTPYRSWQEVSLRAQVLQAVRDESPAETQPLSRGWRGRLEVRVPLLAGVD